MSTMRIYKDRVAGLASLRAKANALSMTVTERTIVVGVDYSDQCIPAVDEALKIAAASADVLLLPLLVLPGGPVTGSDAAVEMTAELVERSKENLRGLLELRAQSLMLALPRLEPCVRFGDAAERLITEASERKADLIAVGTHGRRGLSHLVLGSVAEEVMRRAPCSVLIARVRAEVIESAARGGFASESRVRVDVAASVEEDDAVTEDLVLDDGGEPRVVSEPQIDADRLVLHVLDAPSGQVFVCAFDDAETVVVEPLEGDWVPSPSSASRARVAHAALQAAKRDPALFGELFDELTQRRARERAARVVP